MAETADVPQARDRVARPRKLVLTLGLLTIWTIVTYGVAWFARDLDGDFFGWPFSFWMGAQGALIVYVLIVCIYARVMNRRDEEALAAAPSSTPAQAPD